MKGNSLQKYGDLDDLPSQFISFFIAYLFVQYFPNQSENKKLQAADVK